MPARVTATTLTLPGHAEVAQRLAGPGLGKDTLDEDQVARGVAPFPDDGVGQQPVHDLVDRPRHRGDGGDAEALVDLGPPGVVDAGHHAVDAVVLRGDACRQDVRVVTARDRGQRSGLLGAGPVEVVAVEARAHDRGPGPVGGEATERAWHLVDDGHRVALLDQADGEPRSHPATPDDDDVHRHHATRHRSVGQLTGCAYLKV